MGVCRYCRCIIRFRLGSPNHICDKCYRGLQHKPRNHFGTGYWDSADTEYEDYDQNGENYEGMQASDGSYY